MTETPSRSDFKEILLDLGYREDAMPEMLDQLEILLPEIHFKNIMQKLYTARQEHTSLAGSLKDLMTGLEPLGYYRPDLPRPLIKLLVNGLNHTKEDIFTVLDNAHITEAEKAKDKEFLASCAAITQLGYILIYSLIPDVQAASAGPHVFLIIDTVHPALFVDFSLDSIREIDVLQTYTQQGSNYYLKENPDLDKETLSFLKQYYPAFHVASHAGLSHNIHNNLGITYDKVGRYQEAIEELTAALQLDPEYIDVINNTAVTYFHMGRYEKAIQALQEAIQSNPDNVQAHCNLGNIYASQGRIEEAVREIHTAIQLNPAYAPAHNSLGAIHGKKKEEKAAISEFRTAIELDPDYTMAYVNLGNAYKDAGRYEDAIQEFEKALRIDPECIEANYGMGMAYCCLGRYERAVHPLVMAASHRPELLESVPERVKLKVTRGISRLKGI